MATAEQKAQLLEIFKPFLSDTPVTEHRGYAGRYEALWHAVNDANLNDALKYKLVHGDNDNSYFSTKDQIWIEADSNPNCFKIRTFDDWRRSQEDEKLPEQFHKSEFDEQGIYTKWVSFSLPQHIKTPHPDYQMKKMDSEFIYQLAKNSSNKEGRGLTLNDLFEVIPNDKAIHTTCGIYPNGPYKTNGVPTEHLISHIVYNCIMRPGRALYINGHLVYQGIGVFEEQVQTFENNVESGHLVWKTVDTQPYN